MIFFFVSKKLLLLQFLFANDFFGRKRGGVLLKKHLDCCSSIVKFAD